MMDDLDRLTEKVLANAKAKNEYERLGPTYDIIADVYRMMELRGIDYLELAAQMGQKSSVVARLLSGNANPSLAFLQKLASALDARVTFHLEPNEPATDHLSPKRGKKNPRVA